MKTYTAYSYNDRISNCPVVVAEVREGFELYRGEIPGTIEDFMMEELAKGRGFAVEPDPVSKIMDDMLDRVVKEYHPPENVEAWADQLAEDSVRCGEIEYGKPSKPAPGPICPHGLPDGVNCIVCDTDGAAEAQGITPEE